MDDDMAVDALPDGYRDHLPEQFREMALADLPHGIRARLERRYGTRFVRQAMVQEQE